MQLSVIFPAFRVHNFETLYDSVYKSFDGEFEVILIGPTPPNFKRDNLLWIEDFGCPTRCQQIGLLAAKGEWMCFGWDDGIYMDGKLSEAYKTIKDYKDIVIGKFVEGDNQQYMISDSYYNISHHNDARSPYIPDHFKIFSTGLISSKLIKEVGGFDCQFETMALSVLDLSIRLQFYGCNMILQDGVMLRCSWQPGDTGDHKPVNRAFFENDMPAYYKKYKNPVFKKEIIIDINNWKLVPDKWERRFGNGI